MHIEQILENDTVKVTMTAERESLTAFPIPEPLIKATVQEICGV